MENSVYKMQRSTWGKTSLNPILLLIGWHSDCCDFTPPPTRFCGPLIKTVATVSSWCWDKDLDMSSLYFWKCLLLYTSTYLQVHVDKSEEKRREDSERKEKKNQTLTSTTTHTFQYAIKKKKKKSLPHGNTPTHHHADALKANHTHTRPQTQGFLTLRSTPGRRHYCLTFEQTLTGNKHSLTDSFF